MSTDSLNLDIELAFGEVVDVKSIPSRQVTRIIIEIPTEHHVKATNLLFGKGALVIPAWRAEMAPPYGVTKLAAFMRPSPHASNAERLSHGCFGQLSSNHPEYVKKAGALCRDNQAFWDLLSEKTGATIRSEEDAADTLRAYLGISTRAELATNARAQTLFKTLIQNIESEVAHHE